MPTNRRRLSRGWASGVEWREISSPLDIFILEAELYQLSVFNDRAELLASYPGWRTEYLAAKADYLEANKPVRRVTEPGQAQDQADFTYQFQLKQWQYRRAQTPRIEAWFQGFE